MIFQEMLDILQGMGNYLPSQTACIAMGIAILLLMWINFRLGMLALTLVVSYLFIRSLMSTGDIYSLSVQRIAAGIIIGLVLLVTNIYLIARLIAAWED